MDAAGFVPGESPFSNEEHTFENWSVLFKKSHILPSKCTQPCDSDQTCFYCG